MNKRHLIIISYDAMVYEDLEELSSLEGFGRFYCKGSRIKRMRSIFPSLTYPAHVSILTGANPGKHGIVNNEPSIEGNLKCPWYWFHDPVKVPDLHDIAKKAGLSTASVFWPVSGCHKNIDYLVAEYWPQKKGETQYEAFKRAGTSDQVFFEVVNPVVDKLSDWQPAGSATDEAKTAIACSMIEKYKPNLLTLHLGQIDSCRHRYGIFNDKVSDAVLRAEKYLQQIFLSCEKANIFDQTDFVIVSDHGQLNYKRKMNLNALFKKEGFITTGEDGSFKECSVWAKSANFCAQIYLTNPKDDELSKRVYQLLLDWKDSGKWGIKSVYTCDETGEKYGLWGDFSYVLESDEETLFTSDWKDPVFTPSEPISPEYLRASHGHDPFVGPQPVFLAMGPHVKKGVVLEKGLLIDEGPTFAKLLGLDMENADGKAIEPILKYEEM